MEDRKEVFNAKGQVAGYFVRQENNKWFAVRLGDGETKLTSMEHTAINFILGK